MWALIAVVLLLCLIFAWYSYVQSYRKPSKSSKAILGPLSLPLIGNLWHLNVENDQLLQLTQKTWPEKYGRIYQFWVGPLPYVAISDPQSIQVILSSSKLITKSRDIPIVFKDWLGTGLETSQGALWKFKRRMLNPAFNVKILENFVPIMQEQAALMIQIMGDQIEKQQNNTFDIYDSISRCTLDIVAQTAMGVDVKAQEQPKSEYVQSIVQLTHIVQYRVFRPWLWPSLFFYRTSLGREQKQLLECVNKYAERVIRERIQCSDSTRLDEIVDSDFLTKNRVALLDLLLDKLGTGELSLVDVCDEVNTFMYGGHDTMAVSSSFLLYALATNPEAQERLYEELEEYFGQSDRMFGMEDMGELSYLECCLKEGLRLYPSVPSVARALTEDVQLGDTLAKKGSVAMILIYAMHRDPEYFPDPLSFRPERFLPQASPGRHPYAYIPFSAGPRNCIGQRFANLEEKILVTSVVRHYRLETDIAPSEVVLNTQMILRSRDPLTVRLIPR